MKKKERTPHPIPRSSQIFPPTDHRPPTSIMTDESKPPSQTQLFLHAEFGIPCPSHAIDDERNISDGSSSSPECITTVKQHFDSTNCRPALIGLRGEPVKVRLRHDLQAKKIQFICLILFSESPNREITPIQECTITVRYPNRKKAVYLLNW